MRADKKTYHRGNVREDLIRAAGQVLKKEGMDALSLRRVARDVGVAPSAVYNHFRNHEALLAAVAADGYRQLYSLEVDGYSGRKHSANALRKLARAYLHFASANPELYRLMFSPAVVGYRSDPELDEAGDSSFGISVDWWYGKGAYDPSISAIRYPYALAMWAMMHGLAMQVIDGLVTIDRSDPKAIDSAADSVMDILLEGAAGGIGKKP